MKLIQINTSVNWGSTGRIGEQIAILAKSRGWETYFAYGRHYNPSASEVIRIGSRFDVCEHYAEYKLLGRDGLASHYATKKLVAEIDKIKPDIIHLHNIHDHYLNYPILFNYLNTIDTPIVWTQHDCWAFTGGCGYYSLVKCEKWKSGCHNCPQRDGVWCDHSREQYELKRECFTKAKNLTLVPVSEWLASEISDSFISHYPIRTINNGVDTRLFSQECNGDKTRIDYNIGNGPMLLGVATYWSERKGLNDYIRLADLLEDDVKIVLVGLTEKQSKGLPRNIISIPQTKNADELVALYNAADIVLNLSYAESFGLTTVEGLACGTPGVVYDCTASPELITSETGRVVKAGDVNDVRKAVDELLSIGKNNMGAACVALAHDRYDKDKCFENYLSLYENLIHNTERS